MEILAAIGATIVEFLVLPIARQPGYLINYNSNLRTLKTQIKNLGDIQSRVQLLIDDATRKGEVIGPEVERWRTDVNGIKEEVERFVEDEVKEKESCLSGRCPDLISRYSLSRKAKKKTLLVIQLQREGSFERVSSPAPPPGIEYTGTGGFVDFESRKPKMEEIMAALRDDKVTAIGICGLGGSGKTTAAKEVGRRAEAEKLFDEFVMATVSQTPNLKHNQDEIAKFLGLELQKKEPLNARARRLRARLMNCKRVLVILDDLWKRLDLEEIGIPFGGDHKGCKLLLTSRSQDVCNEMETDRNITIDVLSEVESWNIFKDKAGDCIDSPDLHPIAKDVLNECGRLPIAIVTVGRALRNKREKHVWNDALRQLRKSCPENISQSLAKAYRSLELSYNFLEIEEERFCLLLCSMFKEDANIPVKGLVGYMMGLRILKDVDEGAAASDRVHTLVDKLKSCYLLLDGDPQWFGDKAKYVKMHDVIRDVIRLMVIGKQDTSTSLVSYSAPPLGEGMEDTSSRGFVDFESRRPVIEQIMAALNDEDINAIGIWGIGGVGKTTVAKEVCNRAKVEKLFAVIAMATGSNPDVKEMQDEIAEGIGLKFNQESLSRRAERLRARLMDCERVVVVLDNVWERLDLEAVGIPIGGDHKGCKVMLTSRIRYVMEVNGPYKIFELEVLTREERWNIWKEMSGNSIESPDLRPIAMEVADTCAGLPLLVFTVGTALANKNKDIWNDALRQLRMPTRGGGDYAVILECIKLSYNLLESQEAKSCLLLCSIFERGANIPMEELVKYGMALRLFHGVHDDAVEEARHRLHSSVHTLQRRHLLLHCDKKERIRMHDLVCDAIKDMVRRLEGE